MARKIVLFSAFFIALVLLVAVTVSWFYSDRVKAMVISAINKKLSTPVDVKEIDFSLFKNFPSASLVFEEVFIREKNRVHPDTLLYAKKISFLLSYSQLFSADFSITRILLENAVIRPGTDSNGARNYEIWKEDSLPSQHASGAIRLEKVIIKDTRIVYTDDHKGIAFLTSIADGSLHGAFSNRQFDLEAEAALHLGYFRAGGINYLRNKKASFTLAMKIDNATKTYSIISSSLKLDELNFSLNGSLHQTEEGLITDIRVTSPGSGPEMLLSLLSHHALQKKDAYTYKGTVTFDMRIKGLVNENSSALTEITFGADRVSVIPKKGGNALRQVNFKGFYTNRKSKSVPETFLSVNDFSAELGGRPVRGSLELTDFSKPYLKFSLRGTMDISMLADYLKPDTVETMSGEIAADISFSGKVGKLLTYKASGMVDVKSLDFRLKQKPAAFRDFNGKFVVASNGVEVRDFKGKIGNSDFALNGTFTNVISFIFFPDENLSINASLVSREINLDELLEKKETPAQKDTVYKVHFSDKLNAQVQLEVGMFHFQKFESSALTGRISLSGGVLSTDNLKFSSMDGTTLLKGSMNASRNDSILISIDASVKSISITKLFYQMGDFGQDIITEKNLKGEATAEVRFVSVWSSALDCNVDKVYTKADLTIENGELINFEPTQALAKYVKGADLKNIKFSTLKNQVEIKNRTIYFPSMEIKTSALNLTASGTHTFSNMVDYRIKLLLSQLLGKKVKEQNTEFGVIEDDSLGRTAIYLRMHGPMKNPKFTYDNQSVEEKIEKDIRDEKVTLKNVLREEFGWFKKDSVAPVKQAGKKKTDELEIDYDTDDEIQ